MPGPGPKQRRHRPVFLGGLRSCGDGGQQTGPQIHDETESHAADRQAGRRMERVCWKVMVGGRPHGGGIICAETCRM